MDALHQLEIAWMLILQSLSAWIVTPMRLVSMLGQEEFYMLIMPAIYWSLDAGLGIRVGILLLLGNQINMLAKLAFHSPRPYWLDPRIKGLASESSFGFPSGHAENAAGIWGLLAASARERWVKIVLGVLIFLIGFSRIVLGVHFISDVIAGWALGGLSLWIFLKVEKPVTTWLRARSLGQMLGLVSASTALLIVMVLLTSATTSGAPVPAAWAQNALLAQPASGGIDPQNINAGFTIAGMWFGLLSGAAWLYHRKDGLKTSGTPEQRLLRYLVGAAGVLVLYYGLGQVFPRNPDALSYGLRFIRYALVGGWVSALAPLVFEKLGLVGKSPKEVNPLSTQ